ncbi:MAG: type II secretion system GspH family protein [Calditerrivibrio sp.]|nr:type II secretion system GspH family protein [Calditerrivibrio sp.]
MKKAFTLIEMVIVIVLLGIVSTIGVGLLKIIFDGYITAKITYQLFYEAKFGAERISRELREAIPNSVVLDDNNTSITFVKFSKGGYYLKVDDQNISVDNNTFGYLSKNDNISIYNLDQNSIYGGNICQSSDNKSLYTITDNISITYKLCKTISLDSPQSKFYVVDEVVTFTFKNNTIQRCSSKTMPPTHPIVSNCYTIINNVQSLKYSYTPPSFVINDQIVDIYLEMSKNDVKLSYKHKVHIRNTP